MSDLSFKNKSIGKIELLEFEEILRKPSDFVKKMVENGVVEAIKPLLRPVSTGKCTFFANFFVLFSFCLLKGYATQVYQ